jgi:UDP-N-acetylglucosamine pyrophosphorylase
VYFKKLFDRYLVEKTSNEQVNWREIKSPSADKVNFILYTYRQMSKYTF